MSTPPATWARACSALPARAATSMPASWARAMTSAGGGPSALAMSRAGCPSATSTCERATECSQPSTASPASTSSGSGGTPSRCSVRATKSRCPGGINASRSTGAPSRGTVAGITMSTPYGLPSVLASIHANAWSRSAASLNRTQPSTPKPPARLIAAATCSDGVNPTIGCSMPSRSHNGVRMLGGPFRRVPVRPGVVGFADRGPADLVDQPDGPRHLVAGDLAADVRLQVGRVGGTPGAGLDERGDPLAEPLVGLSDDERVEHVRVRLQRSLDLLREDLLAPGVDARVAAAEQRDRAVVL